jgi:hypothetical protein
MLCLVIPCSAVFQHSPLLQKRFSSLFQSNLDLPLNTKSVHNYATELLVKFGKFWDSGVWVRIFVSPRKNMTPVPNSPHVITLAFDSKLDIKLLQTVALVWNFESWILVILSWAHEILSSRLLRCPSRTFVPIEFFVIHVLLVRTSLWMCI